MNGLIKKVVIIGLMSSSFVHTSQAITWSQVGETTVQGVSLVARAAFWVIKGGGKLVCRCLPQDASGKVTVGALSLGAAAAYMRCPKVAVVSTAVGACAGYLNYLYRNKRGNSVDSGEITPGGPPKVVYTPESETDCFKRVFRDRNKPSSADGVSLAPSRFL